MSKELRQSYDHLYLSPHLDDAVLSCGGQIYQQTAAGESVLIVTITTGDPPDGPLSPIAQELHERWDASVDVAARGRAIVRQRRAEDVAACAVLEADYLHTPIYDCIYRVSPSDGSFLYVDTAGLFGEINPKEGTALGDMAAVMQGLPPATRVYSPLGVGNHVDHQLTRQAAEQVYAGLLFYEEYPYVAAPGALEKVLPPNARAGWAPVVVPLSEAAMQAKIAAIAAYDSQLSSFFLDDADLDHRVRAIARRVWVENGQPPHPNGEPVAGAERYWRRA